MTLQDDFSSGHPIQEYVCTMHIYLYTQKSSILGSVCVCVFGCVIAGGFRGLLM